MSKKAVLIILGIVVVGVLVVVSLMRDTDTGTKVRAEEVTTRQLVEKVSASGRIQPQTKVDITSQINGEIIDLLVREGDRVERGDLLVVLDTVQLRSDLDQALYSLNGVKARLAGEEARLEQAREEFERQERLYADKLTSEQEFKNAKYAFLNAQASHQSTKASMDQAQAVYEKQLDNLRKATIVAPMAGVITYLDAEVGEIAAAQTAFTQGKTLMTVSNLDIFEVEVEVDETEIAKVELNQEASIEVDAFPEETFPGEVVEIGNTAIMSQTSAQDLSTNFRVKVIFNEPKHAIKPGMSATVDITTARRDDVPTVPFSAVVMRTLDLDSLQQARAAAEAGEESPNAVHAAEHEEDADSGAAVSAEKGEPEELKGVFVIRNGKARFVTVETGIADHQNIEITTGLQPGDSVVAGPYSVLRTIEDGDSVRPENQKKPNGKK